MYERVRGLIIDWVRKWIYEWLIKRIFGAALGGIKGWIVRLVFNIGWKRWLKPLVQYGLRQAEMVYRKYQTRKGLKDLQDANSETEIDSSIDRLP